MENLFLGEFFLHFRKIQHNGRCNIFDYICHSVARARCNVKIYIKEGFHLFGTGNRIFVQISMKCSVAVHCLVFIHEAKGVASVTSTLLAESTGVQSMLGDFHGLIQKSNRSS